jgi:polysaccharide pyruvyl transferase WcaK-like protein
MAPPTIRQMIGRALARATYRRTIAAVKPPRRGRTTVSLFGNFGTHNLGNEYTLQAIIHNVRKYLPDAEVNCICTSPREVTASHKVPAFPISDRLVKSAAGRRASGGAVAKFIRRLFLRLPMELSRWIKAFRTLKGTRMLVMTGTGMLGDFGIGPFDLHYEILKWSLLAKARRCKLLFVSVGAGPIAHPLSRSIVRWALSLADYRSYRDDFSKQYLARIGFDTGDDFVYPDLAFSLKPEPSASPRRTRNGRVVGLGLMDYYGNDPTGKSSEATYQDYLEKVTAFLAWLLERKYTVRLLIGDATYDTRVRGDVIGKLRETGFSYQERQIVDEPVASVEELLAQLAATDAVVATRFHNLVLALMLGKPVVALSYHEKISSLMAGAGMAEYCQSIRGLEVDSLVQRFLKLERNSRILESSLQTTVEKYRETLDEQYLRIFRGVVERERRPHGRNGTGTDG